MFFVTILSLAQNPANWTSAWGPSFRHLNAIEVLPNNKIVVVGGWESNDAISSIFTTQDNGANWLTAMDNINAILQDVDFTDGNTGYAVGWAGNILKTTNAGDNWSPITVTGNPGTRNFNGCYFFDNNTGVVVGGNKSNDAIQTILRTTDGGSNWTVVSDNLAPWLSAVHFSNNSIGYAVGDQGTILKSTNGGVSWNALSLSGSLSSRNYNDVYFFDGQTGIAVGGWETNDSISTIIRTTDGGATWSVVMDNIGSMLNSVYFYNANEGYVVGDDGVVYYTNNGGASFSLQTIPANNTYDNNTVYFVNPYHGLIAGSNGKLLWYNDASAQLAEGTIDSPVTMINSNTVSIIGTVDDKGIIASLEFEYGTTMSFGSTIPFQPNSTDGSGVIPVSVDVSGLTPDLIYFGRMKMTNNVGVSYSNVVSFYTGVSTVPNFNFEIWNEFSNQVLDNWQNMGDIEPATSYNSTTAVRIKGIEGDGIGAILHGSAGQSGFSGGIDFTERPDSIRFYANYNIVPNDSAVVLLILKKNGTPIAFHQWLIGGSTSGNFEYKSYPIEYSTVDYPDTMILIFTSSNPFSGSANENSVMIIDDVTFYGATTNVPNFNMELWTTNIRNKAAFWVSEDDFWNTSSTHIVEKSTDAYSGNFAVKLNNLTQGDADFGGIKAGDSINGWQPAFKVNFNHEKLFGYLKYFPDMNDTLFVRVAMFVDGNQIGYGELKIKDTISSYTLFEVPISYFTSGNADSCLIEFKIFKQNGGNPGNTNAFIDNLSFDMLLAPNLNVNEVLSHNEVTVFPNPTEGPLTIAFENASNELIDILVVDLHGKILLKNQQFLSESKVTIDLSSFRSQQCFVIIKNGNNLYSFKTLIK